MSDKLKPIHREILNTLEEYLSKDGACNLRFGQALFNIDINQFPVTKDGQILLDSVLRDIYNDSDEELLKRMKKNL